MSQHGKLETCPSDCNRKDHPTRIHLSLAILAVILDLRIAAADNASLNKRPARAAAKAGIDAENPKLRGWPPRQPEYRESRGHGEFVRNIAASRLQLRDALTTAWNARERLDEFPTDRTTQLVAEKYAQDEWNFRH